VPEPAPRAQPDAAEPGPVLVLGPAAADINDARTMLAADGIAVRVCADVTALAAALDETAGAVLMADEAVTENDLATLANRLDIQAPWSDLPFMVLAGGDRATRQAPDPRCLCAWLGNVVFLDRRPDALALVSAARAALRARGRQKAVRDEVAWRALADSEARLRMALDGARTGTFDWIIATGALRWNARMYATWGIPANSKATVETFLSGLHPDDAARVEVAVAHALDPAGDGQLAVEHRVINRLDHTQRWVEVRGQVRFEAGRPTRMIGTMTDVTDRRHAEERLRRLTEDLEATVAEEVAAREAAHGRAAHAERMQALGQLAGGVAHDFNNVLQAIEGAAGLIEARPDDHARVERYARMVLGAADRGNAITRRLLAFARRDQLEARPLPATDLLESVREMLQHTLGSAVEVRLSVADGLPDLLVDRGQLETALINLATNARDAMPAGGVLTLSADAEAATDTAVAESGGGVVAGSDTYVRLSVTDTGIGIPRDVLQRVTEPFFTTKPTGAGTGLGLAMVKRFAVQSGGTLAIESTPALGTTVRLWLPAVAGVAPRRVASLPEPEPAVPLRVLVVDDDELVRETMCGVLEDRGFSVAAAASGAEALALLAVGEPPDVLVSDLVMPGMDGLSLVSAARQRWPHMPAILVTGYADRGVTGTDGVCSVLRKPLTGKELADAIGRATSERPV
jgi:signal transduction histidine kinase